MVRRSTIFISCSLMALAASTVAAETAWYTVTGEDVHIRCGADSSYYAFTTVETGSRVLVKGEKLNWARVVATGSNFEDAWGYVKYPASETGRFTVSADGATGSTMGATPVLAPNMNADDLAHSWRQLCILPRGETLTILETSTVQEDGLHAVPHTVHKVLLPEQAEGWINMADLEAVINEPVTIETEELDTTPRMIGESPAEETILTETVDEAVNESTNDDVAGNSGPDAGEMVWNMPSATGDDFIDSIFVEWINHAQEEEILEGIEEEMLADDATEIDVVEVELTRLQQLELTYEGMAIADLDGEEIVCLHEEYLVAAEEEEDPVRAEFARMRARQIEIYATLVEQNGTIGGLVEQIDNSTRMAGERELAIANTGDYEVVGRLEASAVFNGSERPKLYRIRDSKTGRTVAYLRPEQMAIASTMLGQHVGIMGLLSYDPTLEVNIVQAARVDLLASNTAHVSVD